MTPILTVFSVSVSCQQKCPTCVLCGIQGHIQRDCPGRPCSICGLPSHGFRPCERPPLWNQHCQRCGMTGHLSDVSLSISPQVWPLRLFMLRSVLPCWRKLWKLLSVVCCHILWPQMCVWAPFLTCGFIWANNSSSSVQLHNASALFPGFSSDLPRHMETIPPDSELKFWLYYTFLISLSLLSKMHNAEWSTILIMFFNWLV